MKSCIGALLLLTTFVFSACSDDSIHIYNPASNDYLPLQVGNEWHFNENGEVDTQVDKYVDSKKKIEGHDYFLIITIDQCSTCRVIPDSLYMRIDPSNGYVYSRRPKSTWEDNWFRLDAKDKDTWSYKFDNDYTATITVTVGQITLGNTIIPDSKAYYYDVQQWADEEYTRTLAKGVGFVEEYSNAWGGRATLTSAKINGKTITF